MNIRNIINWIRDIFDIFLNKKNVEIVFTFHFQTSQKPSPNKVLFISYQLNVYFYNSKKTKQFENWEIIFPVFD